MSRLVPLAILLAAGCDASRWRCHSGYYVTSFHEAYTESGQNCTMVDTKTGQQEICVPFTRYHPARCETELACVISCADWDSGQAEAHQKHGVRLAPQVVDHRCKANGEVR